MPLRNSDLSRFSGPQLITRQSEVLGSDSGEQLASRPRPDNRVGWVDTAKGVGIILVVFGHVLRSVVASGLIVATPAVMYMDAWIYSFHMPLFFFVSGLFLARSATKPAAEFVWEKIGSIAYPYFVWSTITLAIKSPLGQHVNQPRTLLQWPDIMNHPIEQFWFLYVLFFLTIFFGFVLKFGMRPWIVVLIAASFYPGVLPLPWSGWIPFEQARSYSIYLALGMAVGIGPSIYKLYEIGSKTLTIVAVTGFLIVTSLAVFHEHSHLRCLDFFAALSGTSAVVASAVFANRSKTGSVLNFLGRHSLEIFVAHTIASASVRVGFQQVLGITVPVVYISFCTIVGLFAPILLVICLKRLGVTWAFTLPKRSNPPVQSVSRGP